ncbi:MAG: hypothetical protein K2R93_21010 [Gemmatimonadaceae bacterium]|nr:hypothetical protein [Gemmatimonadaceae bacterium]
MIQLLALLVVGAMVWVVRLQLRYLRSWSGIWRVLSLVPPLLIVAQIAVIAWDTTRDPTSHNLWPFEIVISVIAALAAYGLLALAVAGGALLRRQRESRIPSPEDHESTG